MGVEAPIRQIGAAALDWGAMVWRRAAPWALAVSMIGNGVFLSVTVGKARAAADAVAATEAAKAEADAARKAAEGARKEAADAVAKWREAAGRADASARALRERDGQFSAALSNQAGGPSLEDVLRAYREGAK